MAAKYEIILLLGSNLGDKKKNLEQAKQKIETKIGEIASFSPDEESQADGYESNNTYFNCAVRAFTSHSPIRVLSEIKTIEREMGREKDTSDTGIYTDRVIDIDIVRFSGLEFHCSKLDIPHKKHIFERAFSKRVLDLLIQQNKMHK